MRTMPREKRLARLRDSCIESARECEDQEKQGALIEHAIQVDNHLGATQRTELLEQAVTTLAKRVETLERALQLRQTNVRRNAPLGSKLG